MRWFPIVFILTAFAGCGPKENVKFKQATNIRLETVDKKAMLKADLLFHNPNDLKMKLRSMKFDIFVNGKKGGVVDQTLNQEIKPISDFIVPVEVALDLKELGLLDTIIGFLGGKKYALHIVGSVKAKVHGLNIKVPVEHKEGIKIR